MIESSKNLRKIVESQWKNFVLTSPEATTEAKRQEAARQMKKIYL